MSLPRLLGIITVIATVVVGPFFRGYFFPLPMLTAQTAIGIAFLLWLYGRRKDRLATSLPGGWGGALLLGLLGVYILQFGWASYARGNLDWVLRVAAAYMAFVMMRAEAGPRLRQWLGWGLVGSAVAVSLVGILEYVQFFADMPQVRAFLGVYLSRDRLYTVFQYPNTGGTFLLAILLIASVMMIETESLKRRLLLGAASGIMALAVFLTFSRGVIVVLPGAALLLLIGLPRTKLLPAILYMVSGIALPMLVVVQPIARAAAAKSWEAAMLWTLLAAGVAALAVWGTGRILKLSGRTLWIGFAGLLVTLALGGGLFLTLRPGGLPNAFSRLQDITLSSQNAQSRLLFTSDALRMAMDQPWGFGGTGWERNYRRYQEAFYIARETHNHYAQVLVEAGVLGLLFLIGALASTLWAAFRSRKDSTVGWAMAAAGGTLAAHAVIDFDLSFFVLWTLLWVLVGAAQRPKEATPLKNERRWILPASVAAALLITVTAGNLTLAENYFKKAEAAAIRKDFKAALPLGQTAIKLDPINTRILGLVSTLENAERATELDPNNPQVWINLAERHAKDGRFDLAIAAGQKAIGVNPMLVDHYERLAGYHSTLMIHALENGDKKAAAVNARGILEVSSEFGTIRKQAESLASVSSLWRMKVSASFQLSIAQALMVTQDLAGAEERFKVALGTPETKDVAAFWLHALYTAQRNEKAATALKVKPESLGVPLYGILLNLK